MSRILIAALGVVMAMAACQPAGQGAAAAASIRLVPLVEEGLESPVFVTHAGDGSGRLFVVEQPGRIRIVQRGRLRARPFLAIEERITAGGEQGLLGLAFHPDFARNRRFFVNYTRESDGATVISEFRTSPRGVARANSERILLTIAQPFANHNGGMIAFGPDGFLYIGMGDGGSGGDPQNRAQDPDDLLGKMLRIDVNAERPYAIPADNPFARRGGGRPEIYALGLRNPWRFSFDHASGALYVGDVGQRAIEEVDIIQRGGNYGWRRMEGRRCFNPSEDCQTGNLELPVAQYAHEGGRCSITGGYVYRGRAIPDLQGTYVYGDYCSGEVFGLRDGRAQVLLASERSISSFGENQAGELFLVDHDGAVLRLAPESE